MLCLRVCVRSKLYIMTAVLTVCSQTGFWIPFLRDLWNKIQPPATSAMRTQFFSCNTKKSNSENLTIVALWVQTAEQGDI